MTSCFLQFNCPAQLEQQIAMNAGRLAAILIDPMPSRAELIEPTQEFIATINKVAKQHGIVIIADEVLNLRQGFAGASARWRSGAGSRHNGEDHRRWLSLSRGSRWTSEIMSASRKEARHH